MTSLSIDVDHEPGRLLRRIPSRLLHPRHPVAVAALADGAHLVADIRPHRGLDVAGVDDVRGDAGPLQLRGKVPGELVESDLRRAVGAVQPPGRVQRRRGRKVHDPAPACVQHTVEERAGHEIGPHRIDHERFDPFPGVAVLHEGDRAEDPGGIDENGGPAEPGFDRGFEAVDIGRVRDICRESRGAARDGCDGEAARFQRLCDCLSDAAAGSGDDCDVSFEVHGRASAVTLGLSVSFRRFRPLPQLPALPFR